MPHNKLQQKIQDLTEHWYEINAIITGLDGDYTNETRSDERRRIQQRIDQHMTRRADIEHELSALEKQQRLGELRRKLSNEERNGSYRQAIETAEKIIQVYPDETQGLQAKITQYREKLEFYQPALEALGQLNLHFADLGASFHEKLVHALHPKNKRDDMIRLLLPTTQQFLQQQMPVELYKQLCETILTNSKDKTETSLAVDYADLSEKILGGHTVLFLGNGLPELYQQGGSNEQALAKQLAESIAYQGFQGNLATIAELYQLRPGGKKTLLDDLQRSLPQEASRFILYQALANTTEHLILVTSAYDRLLEETFLQAGKPFVEMSSIINRTQNYDVGHVVLNYSDDDKDEMVYPQEQLSTLNLLEDYTVIYKIRGTCANTSGSQLTARKDALTLSESNYLTFAENARKIIPNFLAEHLREREILFVGFSPRSWEERLLARTLLNRRDNSDYLCLRMGEATDPLEAAFWKKQGVEATDIELSLLDAHLQEAIS